jgi:hypothetical protein
LRLEEDICSHTGDEDRSGMNTTELRAKIKAVSTGGLFFRLLTR